MSVLNYLRQLAKESIVYGIAGVVAKFINVILVPLYTRIFTPEDYGVMSLVTTTMAVVSIFVVLGLDSSAARWYWDESDVKDRKCTLASWAWCQIVVSSVFAVLTFLLADWLGEFIGGRADAALYFRLTALTLPLSTLVIVTSKWLRMQRRPWINMAYTLGNSIVTIILTIVLVVFLNWGVSGVYAAAAVAATFGTIVALWLMGDWISPLSFRWVRLGEMLAFSMPLIPGSLCFWIVNLSDRYFLQFYTTTSEVGLYQVGSSLAAFLALLTGAFQQAWGPFAMSIHKREDAKKVYANVLLAYAVITSIAATTLALLAPEAITLLATEKYLEASSVVGVLAFGYVAIGLYYIAAIGCNIMKDSRPIGLAIIYAAGLNIMFNLLLVPTMGKIGAAIATLLSQSVLVGYLFWRSQLLYPIPYRFKPAIAILGLAGVFIWVGNSWQFSNLWIGIACKLSLVLLFIPALFLCRIVTPKQLWHLLRAAKNGKLF